MASCIDEEDIVQIRPREEQLAIDREIIQQYIEDNNLEGVDTTETGVRYLILEPGNGETTNISDIASIDYTGKFTDNEVFDSTIEQVERDNGLFSENANYVPLTFTHTSTGWPLNNFVPGFRDGVTAVMSRLELGGKGLIIMPSTEAFGTQGTATIPPNTVLVYEIFLVKIRRM